MEKSVLGKLYTVSLGFLLVSGCLCVDAAEEIIDRIVAVVNNEVITLSDLSKVTSIMLASAEQQKGQAFTDDERAQMTQKALDQLIERKLIEQKAKEVDIKITDKEINRAIEDVLKRNNITLEQLQEILKKEKSSLQDYRVMMKSEILQSKVIGREVRSRITVTDKDIQDYYEKNIAGPGKSGERIHIQQILITIPPDSTPAQIEKLEKKMDGIRQKILAGENFGKMAVEYSQDPSAREGGDLGNFSKGDLQPAIESVAFSMEKGEVSQVIRSSAGLHLIKIVDKQTGAEAKGWESQKQEIEDSLYRQAVDSQYQKWMDDLRKKAYIKTYL
jgi:peptidyl-prolyl cis-trans isomerase SurA